MHWLAHGECELPSTDDWLSERESAQVATIRFTKRRSEYLTRRWTAKRAVATVLGLDRTPRSLATVEIRNRDSGAPYVVVDREPAAIDLSLSDRAGWAVCLVGPPGSAVAGSAAAGSAAAGSAAAGSAAAGSAAAGSLGIDLEVVEPRTERFVTDFFTAREAEYVLGLPTGEPRDEAANLIWSAKEAALKLQQVGLRADTRTVEVTVDRNVDDNGWSSLVVTASSGVRMPGWWRRDGVFLSTIAFAEEHPPPQLLAGGADLTGAEPLHSWVDRPVV